MALSAFGERFLTAPALFPGRISGEPWGDDAVSIGLAEESVRIAGLSKAQRQSLAERYGPRLKDESDGSGDDSATLRIFRAAFADFLPIDTRGWEYEVDVDWSASSVAIAGMRLMARIDLESWAAGLWTSVDDVAELWGIVENVLRPLLAARLLANGGLLVHAAAVGGLLFAGPSGAGKSTIARMALDAGLPVLSDDLSAVVRSERAFTIVPLPFTGDIGEEELSHAVSTLQAIVAIEKGPQDSIRELPLADAAALLVRCAPYVNRDPHRTPLLLERAAEIAGSARRLTLTFRRDGNVWPILTGKDQS